MELGLVNQEYLSVRFQYDQSLVKQIRDLENRKWNPDEKRWEIHIAHLPDIMKIFYLHPSEIDQQILDIYQKQWISTTFTVRVENHFTFLSGTSIPVEKIDEITSFRLPGSEYNPKYTDGSWDGRKHLFNKRDHCFPSGLLPKVLCVLKDQNFPYTLQDARCQQKPALKLKTPQTRLRNYQKNAVEKALEQKRGILEMATGSGKTLVAAHIISRLNLPAIFFVHTRELLYQTKDFLKESLEIEIGQVGDGSVVIRPITVATIQTIIRAVGGKYHRLDEEDEDDLTDISKQKEEIIKLVENTPVVFFDECHHLPADTCFTVAMKTKGAFYRYGLSATPYRADRQDMLIEAALGQKIVRVNASVLIDEKYLVAPRIHYLALKRNGKPPLTDYNEIYQTYIVTNPERNKIILERSREFAKNGLTTLILVQQVKHGNELHKLIPEAEFIHGTDSTQKRNRVLKEFKEKNLKILIATTLADEGLDVPSLGAVILAGGGKSETRALQRVGRALRPSEEKTEAIVIDFIDTAPYLKEHSLNRLEIFKTEPRFKIEIEGDLPFLEPKNFMGKKSQKQNKK